ncbi:MAG TPA: hypothetical protein VLG69_03770 [Candidatus Andersenbacteria bacterium]|nr:hypothetical protein [Candidatus Andersenbacteria bacterium]
MQTKGYKLIALSVLANIILWILVFLTFPKHDPSAILHYTAGVGVDFVGSGWQIFILPSIGLAILILNALLAQLVKSASIAAYWIFWASLPIIEVLLIGTYIILLRLNS